MSDAKSSRSDGYIPDRGDFARMVLHPHTGREQGGERPVLVLSTRRFSSLTGYALVFAYEWTHFLIHTAYRPRTRYYRSIWHGHRLHHFKNEHYWHGITNTISDTVLRTNPDQKDVRKSGTARALHGGGV